MGRKSTTASWWKNCLHEQHERGLLFFFLLLLVVKSCEDLHVKAAARRA